MTKTSAVILFGANAITARAGAVPTATNKQSFSSLDELFNEAIDVLYASFEPDRWLLDGNYKFIPDSGAVGIGWTSLSMSDASGVFSSPPAITITLDDVYSTNAITLRFAESAGEWADDITVAFYNSSDGLIRTDNYTPSSSEFSTNQAVSNYKKIIITINGTNKAYRYSRLYGVDLDTTIRWTGENLKSAKLVEEISPLSIELPSSELRFTLHSDDGDFSIVDPAEYYENIREGEPLEAYEIINSTAVFLGKFYIKEWDSVSDKEAEFVANDAIAILEKLTYYHPYDYYDDWIHYDTYLERFFGEAGVDYEIDPSIGAHIVHDILYRVENARIMLAEVLFQLGAYATCSRSRVVKIMPFVLASDLSSYDHTLGSSAKSQKSDVGLRKPVTSVTVFGHTNIDSNVENNVLFSDTLPVGTHTIVTRYALTDYSGTAIYTIVNSGGDWVTVNVTVEGTFIITETYSFTRSAIAKTITNGSLPSTTPKNAIEVDSKSLYFDSRITTITQRVYDYFLQRYIQQTKLYGYNISVGETVLIDTQKLKQIKGVVERLEVDLTKGFVSNIDIVGVVV